jgi:CheY-like chemotaxis protein
MKDNQQNTRLSILLADDDKDDRFFFEAALQGISISTVINTVNDGEQLMDYLNKNSENIPDILFLDLSMPRMNGFECLSEIKECIKLKVIYVIMFSTAFPRDLVYEKNIINKLLNMGAQDFIRKPSDFTKLKEVVSHAIIKAKPYISKRPKKQFVIIEPTITQV